MQEQALNSNVTGAFRPIELSLHRSELHFRRLLEKLPAAAYTCDSDGLITYFNHHAEQIWGRAPVLNDVSDRFCGSFKLFSTDGTPIAHDDCWMALALKTNKEYNGEEIVIERPDGRRLTVLAHANPIHDDAGNLVGAVNVLVDINERKTAEIALREADRSKNEFLATLAHELRNPLAPIRNAVQLLQLKGSASPELQWAVDLIDRQMDHMTRLIDDLLDIGRITGNKLELRKEQIELAEVVHAALETSRPLIDAGGHELTVTLPEQPIYLEGDATRLAQIVSNLLNNSAKYTERGGRISVTAKVEGEEVAITVRDTGIGIPPAMLPYVFEMFTQCDRVADRTRGGLGIGLTLVKRLVEMHGGTISAYSEGTDKGSAFVVRLKVSYEAPNASQPTKWKIPEHQRSTPPSTLRVLVVEDNWDSATSLDMLLRIIGNDVRIAHDGFEAMSVAELFRPDVALVDIGLPKMSGYDVAQSIRQQHWGKDMILIATTGWGQNTDRDRSKEAGFDHHLVKPVDPAVLMELLSTLGKAE